MWNAPQILGVEEILGVESIEKGWAQLIKGWRGSCWVAPQCFTLPRPTPPAPFYHNQIYLTLAPVHNPIYATDQQGQWIARLLLRTPIIQPATAPHSNPPDTKTGKNEKVKKQKQSDQGQIIAIKPYFLFQVLKNIISDNSSSCHWLLLHILWSATPNTKPNNKLGSDQNLVTHFMFTVLYNVHNLRQIQIKTHKLDPQYKRIHAFWILCKHQTQKPIIN